MVITRIQKKVAQVHANRFRQATTELRNFTTTTPQDAYVGSRFRISRAHIKVARQTSAVKKYQAKLSRIEANLQNAENSLPGIRQVRQWYWSWRQERIGDKLANHQERLGAAQAYQTGVRQAMEQTYQAKVAKRQAKVEIRTARFDRYLNIISTKRPTMQRLLEQKIRLLESLNQQRQRPKLDQTLFRRLRTKLVQETRSANPRQAAFRLLEIDHGLDTVRREFLTNTQNVTNPNRELRRLISFSGNPPA